MHSKGINHPSRKIQAPVRQSDAHRPSLPAASNDEDAFNSVVDRAVLESSKRKTNQIFVETPSPSYNASDPMFPPHKWVIQCPKQSETINNSRVSEPTLREKIIKYSCSCKGSDEPRAGCTPSSHTPTERDILAATVLIYVLEPGATWPGTDNSPWW